MVTSVRKLCSVVSSKLYVTTSNNSHNHFSHTIINAYVFHLMLVNGIIVFVTCEAETDCAAACLNSINAEIIPFPDQIPVVFVV